MGRKWTKEQREAASLRAKAAIAAKNETPEEAVPEPTFDDIATASTAEQASVTPEVPVSSSPADPGMQNVDFGDILRRLNEVEANAAYWRNQALAPGGPRAGQQGLVGTFEKYNLDPSYYPDPRPRLAAEVRLQRFAFDMNYELEWLVTTSSYKTIDGINTREPKFTLQLNRIVMDDDSGEPTNRRWKVCQAIFHEDPDAAIVVARDNGLDIKDYEERAFLDEMRYLRMRDWLLEAFYPPKPVQEKSNKREIVINGKLVEMWEINSETTEPIPFKDLKSKF